MSDLFTSLVSGRGNRIGLVCVWRLVCALTLQLQYFSHVRPKDFRAKGLNSSKCTSWWFFAKKTHGWNNPFSIQRSMSFLRGGHPKNFWLNSHFDSIVVYFFLRQSGRSGGSPYLFVISSRAILFFAVFWPTVHLRVHLICPYVIVFLI